jgi:hypothetical protein
MKTLARSQKKALFEAAEKDPEKTAEEVIEEARRPPQQVTLRITLLQATVSALDKLAEDDKTSREDTIVDLIDSGLKQKGYR